MVLEAFLFFLWHYAFLVWIGMLSYGIGRRLMQSVHFDHPAEQYSFCTTLGLGFFAYLILLIGTLQLLHRWFILSVIGVIFLLCSSVWLELLRSATSAYQKYSLIRRRLLIYCLLTILLLPVLLMPLYPPTAFDSTMYHLTYAKIYAQTHKITITPYLRYPVFTQTNEMLFTLAFLLYDEVTAQMIQFLMMGVLSMGLFAFGRKHFSQKVGIGAMMIFLSNPMVLWLGTCAYIDIGLALFVTMAIYSFFNWSHSNEIRWLILGGLFLGFAAGSKYSALFFLILFSGATLYSGFKDRRLRHAFLFIAMAVGIASPWYFRNWYYTGNPVFPFFGEIFGYGLWNSQDLQNQLDNLIRTYGMGKSFISFLLFPWNITFHQPKFLMEAPFSPIYLFALPFLFFSLVHSKMRRLLIIILFYTLFWFTTAQHLRYLMPIIPLLSLVTAASFVHCQELFLFTKIKWRKKRILTLTILLLLSSPGWVYAIYKVQQEGYPPYTKKQREVYLTQKLPSFPAYQYLNQIRGNHYSLYALYDEAMPFFANGTFMGDWFGPARFEKVYSKLADDQALHQELRSLGADYFLVRRDILKKVFPERTFSPLHFKLIYMNEHVLLFEIL